MTGQWTILWVAAGFMAGVVLCALWNEQRVRSVSAFAQVPQTDEQTTAVIKSLRADVAEERRVSAQRRESIGQLHAALQESVAEIARLNAIVAQRRLLPISVNRFQATNGTYTVNVTNLGTDELDLQINAVNPERERDDPDYPKTRTIFRKLEPKHALMFPSYSDDRITISSRDFASFHEFYPSPRVAPVH